jgi:hypothetical protein
MPLKFKLIQSVNNKFYEIQDPYKGLINLKLIQELFFQFGLNKEEIEQTRFITESIRIDNYEKYYEINDSEERVIFVFNGNPETRLKLINIFIKEGSEVISNIKPLPTTPNKNPEQPVQTNTQQIQQPVYTTPDPEITKPLNEKEPEPIPVLTPELIDTLNVKSVSLFADSDFRNLMRIYINRPDLFSTFAMYIQSGDIINESLCKGRNVDELSDDEYTYYQNLADKINSLDLGVTNDYVINRLVKYSGHLNLTLRSILIELIGSEQNT